MKPGDLARLRKASPWVRAWRDSLMIKQWANSGAPLLLLEKCGYSDTRWEVLGPDGELASFDDFLMTTRGMMK